MRRSQKCLGVLTGSSSAQERMRKPSSNISIGLNNNNNKKKNNQIIINAEKDGLQMSRFARLRSLSLSPCVFAL